MQIFLFQLHNYDNWIKHKKIKKEKFIYFGSRNLKGSNIKFKMYRKLIGLIFIKK